MIDYKQPDFYRFNMDSVTLVRRVLKRVKSASRILDLGAGSGFIGIEISRTLKPQKLTLVEAQEINFPFMKENSDYYLPEVTETEIVIKSFGEWRPEEKYDLIVSNPPYFLPGRGEASSNTHRGISRTFTIDNWEILFRRIDESLAPHGQVFIVVRHEKKIMEEILRYKPSSFVMNEQVIDNIVFLDLSRLNEN